MLFLVPSTFKNKDFYDNVKENQTFIACYLKLLSIC